MPTSINNLLAENPFYKMLPESRNIDNDLIRSPRTLPKLYETGRLQGCMLDDPNAPEFVRRAARYIHDGLHAELGDDMYWETSAFGNARAGRHKSTGHHYGWQPWLKMDPDLASFGAQFTGDCVSWAIRGAWDRLRCLLIDAGLLHAYIRRTATCGFYSMRGHTGQGADPVGMSYSAIEIGTLLEQQYFDGKYDFRNYDEYVRWGMRRGRDGMPSDLLAETKKHTATKTFLVKTLEGFYDALTPADGEAATAHCGSGMGVSSVGDPVSNMRGGWNHDMDFPGFDITREHVKQDVVMGDQSWGNWNSVTNIPDAWTPWGQGMFAIAADDFYRHGLRSNGTMVFVSPYTGFDAEPIDNMLI